MLFVQYWRGEMGGGFRGVGDGRGDEDGTADKRGKKGEEGE